MIDLPTLRNRSTGSFFEAVYLRGLDWKLMLVGIAVVFFAQFVLLSNAESENGAIPRNARIVLTSGFLIVAFASYFFDLRLRTNPLTVSSPRILRFNRGGARTMVVGLGAFAFAFLSLRLMGGSTSSSDIWIWLIATVGIGALFAPSIPRMALGVRKTWRAVKTIDIVVVLVLVAIVIGINAPDLTDWYYAAIGDEFGFYDLSVEIIDRGIENPFSQRGVDDYHPRLGMLMKTTVMQIVGADNFGWKFSSILMYALVVPGIYLAGVLIGGRVAGVVAAVIVAFSHYLGGMAHIGYDHIDSLLPTVWAVAFFLLAIRTRSPLLFFAAGFLAGVCIYTNVAARIVAPIIAMFAIWWFVFKQDRNVVKWAIPCLIGALVAAGPILLIDGTDLIDQMFGRVLGGQSEPSNLDLYDRILRNFELNLFAFNYNEHSSHFVSGTLMDPLTAAMAVMATGFAFGRLRDPASAFLLIWLALAFGATGAISPYDWHTATTRLFPMVLPFSLLIGVFVSRFIWPIDLRILKSGNEGIFHSKLTVIIVLLAVGLFTLSANYQRAKVETPSVFHNSPIAVSIGAISSEHCAHLPLERIAVVSNGEHLIRKILNSYERGSAAVYRQDTALQPGSPLLMNNRQALNRGFDPTDQFGCIIFTHPYEQEQSQLLNDLRTVYPRGVVTPFSDHSGKSTVSIFKPS